MKLGKPGIKFKRQKESGLCGICRPRHGAHCLKKTGILAKQYPYEAGGNAVNLPEETITSLIKYRFCCVGEASTGAAWIFIPFCSLSQMPSA